MLAAVADWLLSAISLEAISSFRLKYVSHADKYGSRGVWERAIFFSWLLRYMAHTYNMFVTIHHLRFSLTQRRKMKKLRIGKSKPQAE